ncbi:hypothetical protein GP486_000335 [Trichoglossum hirsutum]|uniref:Uncharacterized protein n=1 Tax=Trichoglossum hirsutum TaxID=265104 RepID=A0A9P8LHZ2_9PEZI|nr:hypothetical protein GP486_000335 [Trichoglossum hirsutum]
MKVLKVARAESTSYCSLDESGKQLEHLRGRRQPSDYPRIGAQKGRRVEMAPACEKLEHEKGWTTKVAGGSQGPAAVGILGARGSGQLAYHRQENLGKESKWTTTNENLDVVLSLAGASQGFQNRVRVTERDAQPLLDRRIPIMTLSCGSKNGLSVMTSGCCLLSVCRVTGDVMVVAV